MFVENQTYSGTYNFAPSGAEIVLDAFGRILVRPAEITPSHMRDARMKMNLLLAEWSNIQPNLWEVGLQTLPLTQGEATYSMPASTVMILDMYVSIGADASTATDRTLSPVSRTEYASYANKTQQGPPTVYWYDRLISQTVTFYLVPDGNGPYTAKFYSVRQTQDADVTNGQNVEIPYRFYDAYCAGLAWKLAETYAPQLEERKLFLYNRAINIATTQDTENTPLYITPNLSGYFG
jgi:hypothetical protein